MRIRYDAETDTLLVILREGPVAESDEDKPGTILDYDAEGQLLSRRDPRGFAQGGGPA